MHCDDDTHGRTCIVKHDGLGHMARGGRLQQDVGVAVQIGTFEWSHCSSPATQLHRPAADIPLEPRLHCNTHMMC